MPDDPVLAAWKAGELEEEPVETVEITYFDEEIGRSIARSNARDKIWQLEGYLLRERLSAG